MTTTLDASILIGGVEYADHLLSLERVENLAKPGVEVHLELDSDFPWSGIDPWDELVVTEMGVLTLTGYVEHVTPTRQPAKVLIKGRDTYKRALDWFMEENVITSGDRDVDYWVGYFCDKCGLSYVIDTASNVPFNNDIPFGFKSVDDILTTLSAIGQWVMRVTPDGVLHLEHIDRPSSADYDLGTSLSWEEDTNDTDTRTTAKIWGFQDFLTGDSVIYQETREVVGVNDDRVMVYADPNISAVADAAVLAAAALDQWARLDHVLSIDLIGNPSRHVSDSAIYSHEFMTSGSILDTVTDIKTVLSDGGYNQSMTLGRRAYRYPYFPIGETTGSGIIPTSGSTIWAVNGPTGYVQKIAAYGAAIYLIGNNTSLGSPRNWRVEKRDATSGSLLWFRAFNEPLSVGVARGTDIVADGAFVYASVVKYSNFLSQYYASVVKLDPTSGSTVPLVFPVTGEHIDNFGRAPWMAQEPESGGPLYQVNGSSTAGTVAMTKPTLADVWQGGNGTRNAIASANITYLLINDTADASLKKIKKIDGSIDGSLVHGLDTQEIAIVGTKCYVLSNTATSGSTVAWHVTRFDIGSPTDNFIIQRWTATIPNSVQFTTRPSGSFFRGITTAGFIGIIVSLGNLSTIPLGDDGSVGPAIVESALPGDAFLCNIFDSNVLYSGGVKNNNWYIQGRGFHVNF